MPSALRQLVQNCEHVHWDGGTDSQDMRDCFIMSHIDLLALYEMYIAVQQSLADPCL